MVSYSAIRSSVGRRPMHESWNITSLRRQNTNWAVQASKVLSSILMWAKSKIWNQNYQFGKRVNLYCWCSSTDKKDNENGNGRLYTLLSAHVLLSQYVHFNFPLAHEVWIIVVRSDIACMYKLYLCVLLLANIRLFLRSYYQKSSRLASYVLCILWIIVVITRQTSWSEEDYGWPEMENNKTK